MTPPESLLPFRADSRNRTAAAWAVSMTRRYTFIHFEYTISSQIDKPITGNEERLPGQGPSDKKKGDTDHRIPQISCAGFLISPSWEPIAAIVASFRPKKGHGPSSGAQKRQGCTSGPIVKGILVIRFSRYVFKQSISGAHSSLRPCMKYVLAAIIRIGYPERWWSYVYLFTDLVCHRGHACPCGAANAFGSTRRSTSRYWPERIQPVR